MHPNKALTKLTTKTINLRGSQGGGKSWDDIDWQTVAHSIVGIPKAAEHWLWFSYVGHTGRYKSIYRELSMAITMFIKINRMKLTSKTLDGLIREAILVYTNICHFCHGSGSVFSNSSVEFRVSTQKLGEGKNAPKVNVRYAAIIEPEKVKCLACNGAGHSKRSHRGRCKVIGIDHKSYSHSHETVSSELVKIIGTWEQQIHSNIRKKLSDVA